MDLVHDRVGGLKPELDISPASQEHQGYIFVSNNLSHGTKRIYKII